MSSSDTLRCDYWDTDQSAPEGACKFPSLIKLKTGLQDNMLRVRPGWREGNREMRITYTTLWSRTDLIDSIRQSLFAAFFFCVKHIVGGTKWRPPNMKPPDRRGRHCVDIGKRGARQPFFASSAQSKAKPCATHMAHVMGDCWPARALQLQDALA